MALPSPAIKCKRHHKLIVFLRRHGAFFSSHMYSTNSFSHPLKAHEKYKNTQNQSQNTYKHVAVITFTHHMHGHSRNLESHVQTYGNQLCIRLYSCQWGLPELVHVSLANQQSKQTGNFADSVTYKLPQLHNQITYIYMTHHHVLGIGHGMFFIGKTFAGWRVASCQAMHLFPARKNIERKLCNLNL